MITKVTSMGGNASHIKVAPIGHGLMNMTWTKTPVPYEQCFESIKAGIEELPDGVKMHLNTAELFGKDLGPDGLVMLSHFYEKYPQYKDKTFLSVQGSTLPNSLAIDSSPANLRRSVENCINALRGQKHIDMFLCGRVDPKVPVEDVMKTMMILVKEGKFDYIGLSECGAATLRRAAAVAPIVTAEIEVALWSYEEETKKVIAAAKELGVTIDAYSPLGHGMLTGALTSRTNLGDDDRRLFFYDRMNEKNFDHNVQIVSILEKRAAKRGVTSAQLALAWVHSLGDHVHPLAGSSKAERTVENVNAGDIELTKDEADELMEAVEALQIRGGRYKEDSPHLWG